jgi:hypothetical protein
MHRQERRANVDGGACGRSYDSSMAMLPAMRSVRALTFGLGLAGALLVGPVVDNPQASASPIGIAAEDPGQPVTPDPVTGSVGPGAQGPQQAAPRPHRRHVDNDPVFRR